MGGDDDDDDADPLNSDDDEDEDEVHTDNLVLCQYDKVSRTKNKWKAVLKFGVPCLFPPSLHPLSAVHPTFSTSSVLMSRLARCMGARFPVHNSYARGRVGMQVMSLNLADGRKQDFIFNKASAEMNFST